MVGEAGHPSTWGARSFAAQLLGQVATVEHGVIVSHWQASHLVAPAAPHVPLIPRIDRVHPVSISGAASQACFATIVLLSSVLSLS